MKKLMITLNSTFRIRYWSNQTWSKFQFLLHSPISLPSPRLVRIVSPGLCREPRHCARPPRGKRYAGWMQNAERWSLVKPRGSKRLPSAIHQKGGPFGRSFVRFFHVFSILIQGSDQMTVCVHSSQILVQINIIYIYNIPLIIPGKMTITIIPTCSIVFPESSTHTLLFMICSFMFLLMSLCLSSPKSSQNNARNVDHQEVWGLLYCTLR